MTHVAGARQLVTNRQKAISNLWIGKERCDIRQSVSMHSIVAVQWFIFSMIYTWQLDDVIVLIGSIAGCATTCKRWYISFSTPWPLDHVLYVLDRSLIIDWIEKRQKSEKRFSIIQFKCMCVKCVHRAQVTVFGPILDDRLKEKILKPWKGGHSSHFRVCLCVCDLLAYQPNFWVERSDMKKKSVFLFFKILIFTLFMEIFRFFPYIILSFFFSSYRLQFFT